jgi:hypothetical protein
MDPEIGVLRSRLKQQHGMFAVRAQAVGEHASRRAGTDDDVIEFGSIVIVIVVHCFPRAQHFDDAN